jgi:multiple sugar transport system substrate-binding protein
MNTHKITRRDFLKKASAAAAVIGAAPVVVACGGTAPAPAPTAAPAAPAAPADLAKGPVFAAPAILKGATINYLSYGWYVPELDDAFRVFAIDWATQNKVKFNWEIITDASYTPKYMAAIEAKSGPNLVVTDVAPKTFLNGTVDISDIAEAIQADTGAYYPSAKFACTVEGKWRGIPWGSHPHVLVYRTDWFKEQGYDAFPTTWDGAGSVYEAGVKLKKAGHPYGFTFGPAALSDGESHIWSMLWSFGAKEWNKDGSLGIDTPEMVAGLEFINRLYKDTCDPASIAYEEATNNQGFLGEKISATINVNTIYLPAKASNPTLAGKMNHAPHPKGPAGQVAFTKVPYTFLTSYTKGNDLAAAKQFLYDAFSLSGYAKFIRQGQGYLVPCAPGFDDLPVWPSDPKLAYAKAQAKVGRLIGYDLPEPSALSGQCYAQGVWIKMVNTMIETGDAKKAIASCTQAVGDIKKQLGL